MLLLFKIGIGSLNSGFYERVIDRFTRTIEMESELSSAYANRAEAYRCFISVRNL